MATITINIPDAVAPRVLDAIAVRYEWDVNSGLTNIVRNASRRALRT